MTPFRILITASRTFTDRGAVFDALDIAAFGARDAGFPGVVVVHGACPDGGDKLADEWARDRARRGWPVRPEGHPAQWKRHGRRAGFVRNAEMVGLGADLCLAFIDPCSDSKCRRTDPHGSHGATNCADLADGAGIHVHRISTSPAPTGAGSPSPVDA